MMGELALRYPRPLVVSTGSYAGSAASDAQWPHTVDRVAVPAERLRTIQGLVRWTAHASALARRCRPGFAWCAELKPAAYPARWLPARHGVPYGVIPYGAELLLLDQKIRRSRVRRWTARSLLADAAVFVAISVWTAAYTRRVLAELGLAALGERVRVVPLGTDPQRFRPGLDTAVVRRRYGLDGSPWILTVARLDWHKGFDTVIRALPAGRGCASCDGRRGSGFSGPSPRATSPPCITRPTCSCWRPAVTICWSKDSASRSLKPRRAGSPLWAGGKRDCPTRCARAKRGGSWTPTIRRPWRPR